MVVKLFYNFPAEIQSYMDPEVFYPLGVIVVASWGKTGCKRGKMG